MVYKVYIPENTKKNLQILLLETVLETELLHITQKCIDFPLEMDRVIDIHPCDSKYLKQGTLFELTS